MARRYGEQSWKPTDPRAEDNGRQALGDEMADILWVLLCLANQTGVDLTDEFKKNLQKKTTRDKDRHHQNNKLK
jgi:NTP pyrophosphatase (non-canonical NTP hydrolase)